MVKEDKDMESSLEMEVQSDSSLHTETMPNDDLHEVEKHISNIIAQWQ